MMKRGGGGRGGGARIARIERMENREDRWRGGERGGWRRGAQMQEAGQSFSGNGQIICLSLVGEVVKGKWLK